MRTADGALRQVKAITGEKLEHCSKLSSLGYAVSY